MHSYNIISTRRASKVECIYAENENDPVRFMFNKQILNENIYTVDKTLSPKKRLKNDENININYVMSINKDIIDEYSEDIQIN